MKDPRKQLCKDLADLLAQQGTVRAAKLLELSGILRSPPSPPPASPERSRPPQGPRPISIWHPRRDGARLVFERPPVMALGDHYAVRLRFPAEKAQGTVRICLFGESAAAGYLYAPHFTPAGCLQEILRRRLGPAGCEVIDLARTNERLPTLLSTVEASLQLSPDLLVVFAGNNWNLLETPEVSPFIPDARARQQFALALRAGGLEGPLVLAGNRLKQRAQEALESLGEISRKSGVAVILVVPEVNLADWESRQPVHWLPGDGVARWHESLRQALDLLESHRWQEALEVSNRMEALDGGLCPTTHRLRALAWMGQGSSDEAARACRAEVDSEQYPLTCFLAAPRATSQVQAILRQGVQRYGFGCVDLPQIFEEHTGSPLPGRRLFLDYCHLTSEGIAVAMAATATETLRLLGMQEGGCALPGDLSSSPRATPEAEGLARFGAALHSAHRLVSVSPKESILKHWCNRAAEASSQASSIMRDFIEARCRQAPAVATSAQQRMLAQGFPLLLQHGWRWEFLDLDVIEAALAALDPSGRSLGAEVGAQLLKWRGTPDSGVDLSRPPWLADPLERFFPEAIGSSEDAKAYYRSPWPLSRFNFVCDGRRDLGLAATIRIPLASGAESTARVRFELNQAPLREFEVGPKWTLCRVRLSESNLRSGLNRLTLHWPLPSSAQEGFLGEVIERLEQGLEATLHPVFGEAFSLMLQPVEDSCGPNQAAP